MSDSLHQVLTKIGCSDLRSSTEGYEARCPMPDCSTSRRSFRAAFSGKKGEPGAFYCHKCGTRGNMVDLVMRAYRVDRGRAETIVGPAAAMLRKMKKKRVFEPPDISEIGPYRSTLSEYLTGRGFSPEWIWEYRIGLDRFTNEVVIPSYTVRGDLVGITRRLAEDGQAYYHSEFPKSDHVWGLDLAVKKKVEYVYVNEGQADPLGLSPFLDKESSFATATYGSTMSKAQAKLLATHAPIVVMGYDMDWAGYHGTNKAKKLLREAGVRHLRYLVYSTQDPGKLAELDEEPEMEVVCYSRWLKAIKERLYNA